MKFFSNTLAATVAMRAFSFLKVPLLFSIHPKVLCLSEERAEIRVPLKRWSKNHLGSMYFGALSMGADCVVGMLGLHLIEEENGGKVHFSFKDFQANFLSRAEGDVHFICNEGAKIRPEIRKAISSGERVNIPVHAYATVPSKSGDKPVANFVLTLSLKKK